MKLILHICLADALERHEPRILLPGALAMQVFTVIEPVPGALGSGSPALGCIWRRELAQPGITYECASMEEVTAILRRELNGTPYIM